jgi:hypothetical protein
MLLQIQFPIVDLRVLKGEQRSRLTVPSWPAPLRDEEFVRSTGIVRKRPSGGLNGWIAEDSYCDARQSLKLDPKLTTQTLARWKLRVAFRRFYFDGTAVAKFEIGFVNRRGHELSQGDMNELIADLLTLPVRIAGGGAQARVCRLIDAGRPLAAAYERASSQHEKGLLGTFHRKLTSKESYVLAGTPAIFIECSSYAGLELLHPSHEIKTKDDRLGLFYSRVMHEGRAFPVWTATHPDFRLPFDLYSFSEARKIRLYLLRLNAENQTLVRVLKAINSDLIKPEPRSPQSDVLQAYLNSATSNILNLSTKSRQFADGNENLASLAASAAESFLTEEERQSTLGQLESLKIRKNIFKKVGDQQTLGGPYSDLQLPPGVIIHAQTIHELNVGGAMMSKTTERLIAVLFGAAFLIAILVLAVIFPQPTTFQYTVFRIVLAVSAAGFVSMTPGFLDVTIGNWLRAGGALAVFAVVYFFSPVALVANS